MTEFKQERPSWCPYRKSCGFIRRAQDSACCGHLPELAEHDRDYNSHRVCMRAENTIERNGYTITDGKCAVTSFQVNTTDIEWLRFVLDGIDGKKTSWMSGQEDLEPCCACDGSGEGGPDQPCSYCKGVGGVTRGQNDRIAPYLPHLGVLEDVRAHVKRADLKRINVRVFTIERLVKAMCRKMGIDPSEE